MAVAQFHWTVQTQTTLAELFHWRTFPSNYQRFRAVLSETVSRTESESAHEPARTVCAVAAFAGLRESEIPGLQWSDYTGKLLHVRRSLWRTYVGDTKTEESANAMPVIAPLRKLLDKHKRLNGHSQWIFAGEKKGFSLNLDNLCRRSIRPVIGESWHGWHAFRRGLATNLFDLGFPAEVAQIILRQAAADTTRKH